MYVSIDIETTGLDWDKHQILEFGAVFDDLKRPIEELPTFRFLVHHNTIVGNPYALDMNAKLITEIKNGGGKPLSELAHRFKEWLGKDGVTPAGKNYASFDHRFLEKVPYWECVGLSWRVLDPGSMYWTGGKIPSLAECQKKAGLPENVPHTAVGDALEVVKLIRATQIIPKRNLW